MGVQQSLQCCRGDLNSGSTPGFGFDGNALTSLSRSCRRSHRTSYRSYLSHEDLNPDISTYSGIMAHILNSNRKKKGRKKKGNIVNSMADLPGIKVISPGGTHLEAEVDVNSNIKKSSKSSSKAHDKKNKGKKSTKGIDTPDSLKVNLPSNVSDTSTLSNENDSTTKVSRSTKTTDLSSAGNEDSGQSEELQEHLLDWGSFNDYQEESLFEHRATKKDGSGEEEEEPTLSSAATPDEMPSGGRDLKLHRDSLNKSLCSPCGLLSPSSTWSMYDVHGEGEAIEGQEESSIVEELRKRFQECVELFGDKRALADGLSGQTWTYRELGADVERVTRGLRKDGLGPGRRLILIGRNSPQAVLAILASFALGATLILVSHTDPCEKILSKMRKVKPTVVITSRCCHSAVLWAAGCCASVKKTYEIGGLSGQCYPFSRLLDDDNTTETEESTPRHDGIGLIIFSNDLHDRGYVRKFTFGSIYNRLRTLEDCPELLYNNTEHTVLLALSFTEPFTLINMLCTGLKHGHKFIILPHWETRRALKVCQQYKVTYLPVSSLWYSYILKLTCAQKTVRLPEVVVVYGAISAMDLPQITSLYRLGAKHVLIVYGLVEALGAVAVARTTSSSGGSLKLLNNVQIKMLSLESQEELQETTAEKYGKIHILCKDMTTRTSPSRHLKYTAGDTGNVWLDTGDIGYQDSEQRLHIIGHEKEKLIHDDKELWLCDIEHVLRRNPSIQDVSIIQMEKLRLVVVLRPGFRDSTSDDIIKLAAAAQQSTVGDGSPLEFQNVEFIANIPRSGNGRILREALSKQVAEMLGCTVPWSSV